MDELGSDANSKLEAIVTLSRTGGSPYTSSVIKQISERTMRNTCALFVNQYR